MPAQGLAMQVSYALLDEQTRRWEVAFVVKETLKTAKNVSYIGTFLLSLPYKLKTMKAEAKIMYNVNKSKFVLDKELFKKLDATDIWEFRSVYNGIAYRLLAFWDTEKDTLVIATHGFIKKTQKNSTKGDCKGERNQETIFRF